MTTVKGKTVAEDNDRVRWLADSEVDKPYESTTWFRTPKLAEFVELVEKENKIVGIIFEDNMIGFVLDEK